MAPLRLSVSDNLWLSCVLCTWFMPAFTNSRLGSPRGRTGEDGTTRCPCCSLKKSMNFLRTHLDEYSFCTSACGKAEHFRELCEKTVKFTLKIALRQAVRILTGAAILDCRFGSKVRKIELSNQIWKILLKEKYTVNSYTRAKDTICWTGLRTRT